jgi:predicted RNA-binding protein with PIN domain
MMIVIIDGYNLLKNFFPKQKDNLKLQRKQLIKQLGYYKQKKQDTITDIIVVFDAGPFSHAMREVHNGVVVIFAGQRSSADRWIVKYCERNRHKPIMLVTMDKELISHCQSFDVDAIRVDDFYHIVHESLLDQEAQIFISADTDRKLLKYEHDDTGERIAISQDALDLLMEQASLQRQDFQKDDESGVHQRKKGKAYRLSKKEKKRFEKIKKLL